MLQYSVLIPLTRAFYLKNLATDIYTINAYFTLENSNYINWGIYVHVMTLAHMACYEAKCRVVEAVGGNTLRRDIIELIDVWRLQPFQESQWPNNLINHASRPDNIINVIYIHLFRLRKLGGGSFEVTINESHHFSVLKRVPPRLRELHSYST